MRPNARTMCRCGSFGREQSSCWGAANGNGVARRPFHWLVEFPEVFSANGAGGFDAMVGNPPFVGGKKLTGLFGDDYRDHLVLYLADGRRGSADLCAYFYLRVVQVLRPGGTFGLLAVNTIAEGDTRQVGLEAMLRQGVALYAARPNFAWPGAAAVAASSVHGLRGTWRGTYRINGVVVPTISAFLSAEDEWSPKPLQANAGKSFIGSYVLGMGFTMAPEEALAHIARDPCNAEVLFPYLNGEDLNSHPHQQASRWVINFWDWPLDRSVDEGTWASADQRQRELWMREGRVPSDYPGRVAADFPDLLEIVETNVKPERQRRDNEGNFALRSPLPQRWWHYADKRPALYHAIGRGQAFARHPDGWTGDSPRPFVVVQSQTSKYLAPSVTTNDTIWSHKVVVFAVTQLLEFGILNSSIGDAWARKQSSTLETRLSFTPSDAFETFPFPSNGHQAIEDASRSLLDVRDKSMRELGLGLSGVLNAVHDRNQVSAPLEALRRAMAALDAAVFDAFDWTELQARAGFFELSSLPANDRVRFTVSEATRIEVLRRLSALNRQRYQEEQGAARSLEAAQAEREAPRKRVGRPATKKAPAPGRQTPLFE